MVLKYTTTNIRILQHKKLNEIPPFTAFSQGKGKNFLSPFSKQTETTNLMKLLIMEALILVSILKQS